MENKLPSRLNVSSGNMTWMWKFSDTGHRKPICSLCSSDCVFFSWLSAGSSGFLSIRFPVCKISLTGFCHVLHRRALKIDSFLFENCCEDENCHINSAYCSSGLLISKAAGVKMVGDWFKWKSRCAVPDVGARQTMFTSSSLSESDAQRDDTKSSSIP